MDIIVAGAFIDGSASPEYSDRRILGVRLRKFCLWHRLLLNTVNSPFMKKGSVTMWDIRVAVGICRLKPFDSNIRKPWIVPCLIYTLALLRSFWPRRVKTAGPQLNALQRALVKPRDSFLAYCGDYLQDPEYTIIPPETGKARPMTPARGKFPEEIEHAAELITWGGLGAERAVWAMPLGKANVYRIIARRHAGNDVDITTEEEKKFREGVPDKFRIVRK